MNFSVKTDRMQELLYISHLPIIYINLSHNKELMNAVIMSFRRGRHTQTCNQLLLEAEGIDSRAKAARLVGKKVKWKSPGSKEIFGKITDTHGNRGVLRARFSRGLPGSALGGRAEILEK